MAVRLVTVLLRFMWLYGCIVAPAFGRSEMSNSSFLQTRSRREECCKCTPMPFQSLLEVTRAVRQALDNVINEHNEQLADKTKVCSWFLDSGTLIAALRYGAHAHQFSSGSWNLVDHDADVTIVCDLEGRKQILNQLQAQLRAVHNNDESWRVEYIGGVGSHKIVTPVMLPNSCAPGAASLVKTEGFHIDVHRFDITDTGTLTTPEPYLWTGMMEQGTHNLKKDLFFPLVHGSWGGEIGAFIPNNYMHVVTRFRSGEYPSPKDPQTDHLATGDFFKCPCQLNSDEYQEMSAIRESLRGKRLALLEG